MDTDQDPGISPKCVWGQYISISEELTRHFVGLVLDSLDFFFFLLYLVLCRLGGKETKNKKFMLKKSILNLFILDLLSS